MTKNQRRIGNLIRKWRDVFGISPQWEFRIKVYEHKEDCPKKERDCAAWILNEAAYLRSHVSFNMWHLECREDLESVVTHELLHVVLDRMDMIVEDSIGKKLPSVYKEVSESITTTLELAFKRVRKKG